jgi:hypothetical protein
VLPCMYKSIKLSQNEYSAFVQKEKKWALIDREGVWKTDAVYDEITDFGYDNTAITKQNGKVGLINTDGKEVLPPLYQSIKKADSDKWIAAKLNNRWGFITKDGQITIPFIFEGTVELFDGVDAKVAIIRSLNKKVGLINREGKNIIKPIYDDIGKAFSGGLVAFEINEKWGYVNQQGLEVIKPLYQWGGTFEEGFAAVGKNDKCGLIDNNGKICLPIEYDRIYPIDGHYLTYSKNIKSGKWLFGLYSNSKKRMVLSPRYERIYIESMAAGSKVIIATINNKNGVWNLEGKPLIPPIYDAIEVMYDRGITLQKNSKSTFLDIYFQPITNKYDEVKETWKRFLMTKKNGKYGLLDEGKVEIFPPVYDSLEVDLWSDLFRIRQKRKWGLLKKDQMWALAPEYEQIKLVAYNRAEVYNQGKWGAIDLLDSTKNVPLIYDKVIIYKGGKTQVNVKGKWGLLDENGAWQIKPMFDDFFASGDHQIMVVKINNKWGITDGTGNKLVPCQYDEIQLTFGDYYIVRVAKLWGVIDTNNILKVPVTYDMISCGSRGIFNCVKMEKMTTIENP